MMLLVHERQENNILTVYPCNYASSETDLMSYISGLLSNIFTVFFYYFQFSVILLILLE